MASDGGDGLWCRGLPARYTLGPRAPRGAGPPQATSLVSLRDVDLSILRWLTCDHDPAWAELPAYLVDDEWFGAAVFTLLWLLVALGRRSRARAMPVLLAIVLAVGVGHGLREVIWRVAPRARPANTFPADKVLTGPFQRGTCASRPDAIVSRSYPPKSPSFPSSHTITAGCIAAALAYGSRWVGVLAWLYAGLVGLGRLWWTKHWPSDVVGSLVLSAAIGAVAWRIAVPLDARIRGTRIPGAAPPGAGGAPP